MTGVGERGEGDGDAETEGGEPPTITGCESQRWGSLWETANGRVRWR